MASLRNATVSAAFALALGAALVACAGSTPMADAPGQDVELPGVDTREFTARERHEFSQYVTQLPSPCKEVAVPVAQCVREQRACPACSLAAQWVARSVRDGLSHEQVAEAYRLRFDPAGAQIIPVDGSPARGPEDAPVTLVEFADFECPFCQKVAPELDKIWEARKDKVRFVYKFMPIAMHPHGESSARAAAAALLQGKFWELHHALFANGQHLEPVDVDGYARTAGLDLDRFHADLTSPAVNGRLAADKKLADELGVKGTPTVFIDGREYDPSKGDLADWLDQEIAARAGSNK
jgi:protein-disulfide isomerase